MRLISLTVAGLLALCLAIGFCLWKFNAPPVDKRKLSMLKIGDTQEEVRLILGEPTKVYGANGCEWAYSRPLGWSIVYVFFDDARRFSRYEYDY
jgi:hypothetical protein